MSSDWNFKCRTCLSELGTYYQVVDKVEGNYKIIDMLDSLVPQIKIRNTSPFSSFVCHLCVEKILNGYKFQQMCLKTNDQLNIMFGIAVLNSHSNLEDLFDPLGIQPKVIKAQVGEYAFLVSALPPEEAAEDQFPIDELKSGEDSRFVLNARNEKWTQVTLNKSKVGCSRTIGIDLNEIKSGYKRKTNCNRGECDKKVERCSALERHKLVHSIKKPFQSNIADAKQFKFHSHLHKTEDLRSEVRQQSFAPINNHHKNKKLQCDKCKKEYQSRDILEKHLLTHSSYVCSYCDETICGKSNFLAHKKRHKWIRKSKSFSRKSRNQHFQFSDIVATELPSKEIRTRSETFLDNAHKDISDVRYTLDNEILIKNEAESIEAIDSEFISQLTPEKLQVTWFRRDESKDGKKISILPALHDHGYYTKKKHPTFLCRFCHDNFEDQNSFSAHCKIHENQGFAENTENTPNNSNHDPLDNEILIKCETESTEFIDSELISGPEILHENHLSNNEFECGIENNMWESILPDLRDHEYYTKLKHLAYQCPFCPIKFEDQNSLSAHYRIHENKRFSETNENTAKNLSKVPFAKGEGILAKNAEVIDNSSFQFKRKGACRGGRIIKEFFSCEVCGKVFDCHKNVDRHASVHYPDKPYECEICKYRFKSVGEYRIHFDKHKIEVGKNKYAETAQEALDSIKQYAINILNQHLEDKTYKCIYCSRVFNLHDSITVHTHKRHKILKRFKCRICGKRFESVYVLREHMAQHCGNSKPQCEDESQSSEIQSSGNPEDFEFRLSDIIDF